MVAWDKNPGDVLQPGPLELLVQHEQQLDQDTVLLMDDVPDVEHEVTSLMNGLQSGRSNQTPIEVEGSLGPIAAVIVSANNKSHLTTAPLIVAAE